MWIFCGGMFRSASTLQYQIAVRLVEMNKKGLGVGWTRPEEFDNLRLDYESSTQLLVFKSHVFSDEVKTEFDSRNALGLYIYRDIRDVVASMMRKESKTFEQLLNNNFIQRTLDSYDSWTRQEGVMVSRYEDVIENTAKEVQRIGDHLGLEISEQECVQISEEFSLKNQAERIAQFKEELQTKGETLTSKTFNPNTLLHVNHLTSGEIGAWQQTLSLEQVAVIEEAAYMWLLQNNYTLTQKSTAKTADEKFYGQHGEDFLLWEFFENKGDGFFIDVGAFDGVHLSNSYFFEKKGWKGICVEPHPAFFNKLQTARPGSLCLNYACADSDDISVVDFYAEELGLLSSLVTSKEKQEDIKERYKARGLRYKSPEKEKVKCTSLNRILDDHNGNPQEIDFISIDVEGAELQVLQGVDFARYSPRVIVVETNTDQENSAAISLMAEKGYKQARKVNVNQFFVKTEEDLVRINQIKIDCLLQTNLHPLGEEYTVKQFLEDTILVESSYQDIFNLLSEIPCEEINKKDLLRLRLFIENCKRSIARGEEIIARKEEELGKARETIKLRAEQEKSLNMEAGGDKQKIRVLEKKLAVKENELKGVYGSRSFKIGKFILTPFRFLKKRKAAAGN